MFLGIDCGTQGTKALILDADSGQVMGQGSASHHMISGENGRREQETGDWLTAFEQATAQALAQAGIDGQQILGIGVSGQQHGLVLLDADGQALRPAKLWCDTESTPQNERLLAELGGEQGSLDRLGLVIAPGYTVSKLLWTREHHPEIFERIAHVLLPHDYLNFWLTGQARAEYGDASGTGYFNVRETPVGPGPAAADRPQRPSGSRVAAVDRGAPAGGPPFALALLHAWGSIRWRWSPVAGATT